MTNKFEGYTPQQIEQAQRNVGCEGCGCGGCDEAVQDELEHSVDQVYEDMTTAADAGIPADTSNMGKSVMGPLFKRYRMTDNRLKKNKTPRLLKKFKEYKD